MNQLLVVAAVVVAALAGVQKKAEDPMLPSFKAWMEKHQKSYEGAEQAMRFKIWKDNADRVMLHQLEFEQGIHKFSMGMNKFADLTNEEFQAIYLTPNLNNPAKAGEGNVVEVDKTKSVPASMDWRDYGVVTPVKDQGQCGSCWSFAGTGAMEGAFALKNGTLLSFSEQQQVDCNYYCYGCNGGWAENCFYYWKTQYGAVLETDYPYKAQDGYCHTSGLTPQAYAKTYYTTVQGDESSLEYAVGTQGPVAIAIDASHYSFQLYSGGIYSDTRCSSKNLDHAVLAVGYGSEYDGDYWIVKNSWGEYWGDKGYIYMARNDDNMCGVASDGSYPVVA